MEQLQHFLRDQLEEISRKGLLRDIRFLDGPQGGLVRMEGREVIMLGSNNYLGLAFHPDVVSSAVEALKKFGAGQASVREVCGTNALTRTLEEKLAAFYKMEKCLVFNSCSSANIGLISALMGDGSVIFSDEENHASIVDGCRAARGTTVIYPHNRMNFISGKINEFREVSLKMIVTDGVFSMSGDIAPLPELLEISKHHSAILVLDEAHSAGVLGETGMGTPEHFGLEGQIPIITGTLGKSFGGGSGGYVVGSKELIDFLFHRSRSFIFTNAIPPAMAACALKAIDLVQHRPDLVSTLHKNAKLIRKGLLEVGFNIPEGETPIIPVLTKDTFKTMTLSQRLFQEGVFAPGIGYPVVPEGEARIRIQASAILDEEIIDKSLTVFKSIGQELRLI